MTKRTSLAILAVFVAWTIGDFIIHGLILGKTYQETAHLWRPQAEMKMGLIHAVVLISSAVFVLIYALFVSDKNVNTAVKYGLMFGIGAGISMGYGTYAVVAMPYTIALTWFLGTVVETILGGLIVGKIVK